MSHAGLPSGPPPTRQVRAAFGASGEPQLLPGGMARTFRCGDVVLKPVDEPRALHDWVCEVYDDWPAPDVVRVPRPLRAPDGGWAFAGWAAHHWVPGRTARAAEAPAAFRRTCDAFHDVVADLPRPAFIDERDDPWAHGDRVAFAEADPDGPSEVLALLEPLLAARRPVELPSQLVHGDLSGNVLREPGLPDAVIDWPPYFRPRGFALAVVATDAVAWEGARASFLDAWTDVPQWPQLMLRALICRIATRGKHEQLGWPTTESVAAYAVARRPSVDLVLARL